MGRPCTLNVKFYGKSCFGETYHDVIEISVVDIFFVIYFADGSKTFLQKKDIESAETFVDLDEEPEENNMEEAGETNGR